MRSSKLLFVYVCFFLLSVSSAPAAVSKPEVLEPKWPQEYKSDSGKVVLYAPQIEKWDNFKKLEARFAVAFSKSEKESPQLGSFKITADTEVDHERRLVKMLNLRTSDGRFPSLRPEQSAQVMGKISDTVPKDAVFVSLDRLLGSLERSQAQLKEVPVKNDPPGIMVSMKPGILVLMDGQPIWSPIKGSDLKWAVNTNWPLFSQESARKFYLLNQDSWVETTDLKGTWTPVFRLPDAFKKLPADDKNWDDVREHIPGKQLKPEDVPTVYYSEVPAELILIKGEPHLEIVGDTNLQFVSNTESDLFFYTQDRQWYFLVSGRWFRSGSLTGPWEFASKNLPEDFKKIPTDHPRGDVRASVPGTREADEAIILASIPQQAQVDKSKVTAKVAYAGDPQFKPIEGTSMKYAVNTSQSVIQVGNMYYLCYQAVWFASATPNGPWQVADSIPQEIYTIPPSSPVHNVTYVYIYDSTPTTVTVGYTSGYYGAYLFADCIVFGTGYYYPPYYYYPPGYYYPYYYGYPGTYGAAAWYNPYTGTYGRGAAYYGPYGGAGYAALYNPSTGAYARGGYAYGPYAAGGWAEAYNPRTNTYARTAQGSNYYSNWGTSYVRRGDDWARTGHIQGQEAGAWGYKTSDGNHGFVGHNGDDLYVGHDGDVYRRTDDGWQKWDDGGWNNTDRQRPDQFNRPDTSGQGKQRPGDSGDRTMDASKRQPGTTDFPGRSMDASKRQPRSIDPSTVDGLNRDAFSRSRGTQNAERFSNWQGAGGSRMRSFGGGGARPHRR